MAFIFASAAPAVALTIKTSALAQQPDGYVYCTVTAIAGRPIAITASIVSDTGENVTEFGTGSRTTTENGFAAEETAGAFHADARRYHCKATVKGARKRDVGASLTAFDANGVPVETSER